MNEISNGFPKINPECLITRSEYGDEDNCICDSMETVNEAIKLADELYSGYIGTGEDIERKFRLDRYGCYVSIWASIVKTLSESSGKESYTKPKMIPKYVSKVMFGKYLMETFMDKYMNMCENMILDREMTEEIEEMVKSAVEVYDLYTRYPEKRRETIYTRLREKCYGNKKELYLVRINPFPDVEEWIRFAKTKYDVDLLTIPKKWRETIYERDEEIAKMISRGDEEVSDATIDDEPENDTV